MDTNEQIILDLKNKVGDHQALDFLSDWKGVPVVIQGHIQEIRDESIIFRVEPPDSICLAQDEQALILHDIFIIGIQGRILALDIKQGTVELGEFTYIDPAAWWISHSTGLGFWREHPRGTHSPKASQSP